MNSADGAEIDVSGLSQNEDGGSVRLEQIAPPVETGSFWQRLGQVLFPSAAERRERAETRLVNLDEAIRLYPETPANYVLRGEIYLELREYELAVADFSHALEIASAQVEHDDWGLVAQAVQDRAKIGLRKAREAL